MQPVYYERISATQLVSVDLMPLTEDYLITRVFVPAAKRGEGHAARLMELVLADADREGVVLRLQVSPYPDSPMQHRDLRQWYMRLGFNSVDAEHTAYMVRLPHAPRAPRRARSA